MGWGFMFKVYVTRLIPEEGLRIVREVADVKVWLEEGPPSKEVLMEEVKDVDGLLCLLTDRIDEDIIKSGLKLKVISNYAVGFDNIDVKAATAKGIYVTNTPEVLTETVADLTWALMLSSARRIVEADRHVRDGRWIYGWAPLLFLGSDVYEKTLGIVGLGRIGMAVARRARGFNMKVIYYDVVRREDVERELGARYVDLETLLKESDFVTIHAPLSKETYHMIGDRELKLMKKTAYIINTARGAIVEEKALCKALKEGWISGAALDVFEKEPINIDNPLTKLSNVVLAPHIGSASLETRTKMAKMAAENLVAVLKGVMPKNLVNPEVIKVRPLAT